jgi:hypothetical protein
MIRLAEVTMRFPLPFVPTRSYRGSLGFGASREKVRAGLRHAANDLMAPHGTPVLAMADGEVVGGPYHFFRTTHALEIKHAQFLARYCEIAPDTEVTVGDTVKEGQVIGYVGNQPGYDMLHLEFFSDTKSGPLSTKPGGRPPYDRRTDVFDGVAHLDATRGTISHWPGKHEYRYDVDSEGRKFVQEMDLRDL